MSPYKLHITARIVTIRATLAYTMHRYKMAVTTAIIIPYGLEILKGNAPNNTALAFVALSP